ncbi:hypothetical protein HPB52_020139 [Rhipicephalus sanguineus]|uniref:Uncharacterized protein n=1 Tax=Rhipicephalus sanguineus TaxID=34632 RepID=A0A9D4SZ14_RHISA|nr:hypothetical protein HPB52_020139 [Rhipicephalus sanguineus]
MPKNQAPKPMKEQCSKKVALLSKQKTAQEQVQWLPARSTETRATTMKTTGKSAATETTQEAMKTVVKEGKAPSIKSESAAAKAAKLRQRWSLDQISAGSQKAMKQKRARLATVATAKRRSPGGSGDAPAETHGEPVAKWPHIKPNSMLKK